MPTPRQRREIETMWAEPDEPAVIPQLDCPLCHNADRRFIFGTWADPIGVAKCTACGLVHATGRYETHLHAPAVAPPSAGRRDQQRKAFARYDRMLGGTLRTVAAGGRALDIGCDDGTWLDQLQGRGFATEGTAIEPSSAAHRHRVYDVDCTDPSADLGRRYELVTLQDALDRLDRPAAALNFAARHLAPGGVLIVEVANWNDLTRVLWGRRAGRVRRGNQVAFYDRRSLRDAIRGVGLETLSTWSAPQASTLVADNVLSLVEMGRTLLQRGPEARVDAPRGGWLRRGFMRSLDKADPTLERAFDEADWGAKLVIAAHKPHASLH